MEEKKNISDTLLDNLSGGTDQPVEDGSLKIVKNSHRDNGKQIPDGNEDILDPKNIRSWTELRIVVK